MLKLLNILYVPDLTINFISTRKLWPNGISIYFSSGWIVELFFNRKIFAYTDNIKDQFILQQSREQLVFKISKLILNLKIWHIWLVYLSY